MKGKIIGILLLIIIAGGLFLPIGSSTNTGTDSSVVITYGETTYNNNNYKNVVDQYFERNGNINLNSIKESIITASDVNKISSDISQRTYNSNQIFSCAMVDLTKKNNLEVNVDSSITTVTPSMYKSALESAGITQGRVIVTSPITATGESALAGVMKGYETASGKVIPEKVKDAANKEIYTQSEVVNNSNVSAEDVAKLMQKAKEEVSKVNTTDSQTIINIVNNIASNNNIHISSSDVQNIADSIQQTQSVQDQASQYKQQLTDFVNSDKAQNIFDQIWSMIQSFLNNKK